MQRLLELDADGRPVVVEDRFAWIRDADIDAAELPTGPVIVPLALWAREAASLGQRSDPFGVWLEPDEEPESIAADLDAFDVIGVHFPFFTDGRGLSTAALLRTRFDYRGRLRALGDVQRDQLSYMRRCGFDGFSLAEALDPADAAAGLEVMSHYYQGDALDPRPLFRRDRSLPAIEASNAA